MLALYQYSDREGILLGVDELLIWGRARQNIACGLVEDAVTSDYVN